jgi:hypothetical protein
MWELRFIEDTTAPPSQAIMLGRHDTLESAHLAWAFCDCRMAGVFVSDAAGAIVYADEWTREVFHLTPTGIVLQAVI